MIRLNIKAVVRHGVLSFFLSCGLIMPVLQVLEISGTGWIAALLCAAVSFGLAFSSLRKAVRIAVPSMLAAGCVVWLLSGGVSLVEQVFQALLLQGNGMTAALPLYAVPACMLLSVPIAVLSFLMTGEKAGAFPSCMAVILVSVLLWQAEDRAALLWAVPAFAAALTMAALSAHSGLAASRALPAMAAVAAAAVLLVPASGAVVPEWKDKADELRQKILDYFFFTEPRDIFSLSAEGYAPEGSGILGGTAEPNDRLVMLVTTPKKAYLRGVIKNSYTGLGWEDTTGGRRYQWVSPRWAQKRAALFDEELPSGVIASSSVLQSSQITVRMATAGQSTLFVPQRLKSLSVSSDMTPYFNLSSEVFITRNLAAGDTYTCTAVLASAEDAGVETLVEASAASGDADTYSDICDAYTILPGHLQTQVFELAQQAAEGAETPFEKALAIQNWLRRNCRYTLDADAPEENVDFVSNFLLVSKEGYCTYFASAMTVMCRMVGLPARYVEGYVADPSENGTAYVTGMDAHAWTEVYFSGYGWLTFDPTPVVGDGSGPDNSYSQEANDRPTPTPEPTVSPTPESSSSPSPSEEAATPTPPPSGEEPDDTPEPSAVPDQSEEPPPSDPEDPEQEDGQQPDFPWLWLILLLLLALLVLRIVRTAPARQAARQKTDTARWLVWLQALCEALRLSGRSREPSESMAAFLKRIDTDGSLSLIGLWCTAVFYGREEPTEEAIGQVSRACSAVRASLTPFRRFLLVWRRCFVSRKKRDFRLILTQKTEKGSSKC